VSVRLIAATNRDIIRAIAEDQFREDLFHRLNVVQFRLPPCAKRGEDVVVLADHFLRQFGMAMNKPAGHFRRRSSTKTARPSLAGERARTAHVIERALILENGGKSRPEVCPIFI